MASIPDIRVSPEWKDILEEAVQVTPTFQTDRVVLTAKGTHLLIWFGDEPPENPKDGEPMTPYEKLVIENESRIWVRTFLSNSNSSVHLAIEL